ncbi:unnamed protein product [Heterosigma akashiwo]
MFQGEGVSKGMVKYATALPRESIIDIRGKVVVAPSPIDSATQKDVELQILEIRCVSRVIAELPFQIEDASRPEGKAEEEGMATVGQDLRLDYRWIDTRTLANQAIFRIQSGVCALFREFLASRGFVEIHSPKLLGGASEGGSDVFELSYFNQPSCLAQSPQLYKQMTAACGDFDRVMEVGPVFRAENSNTNRHLCEFTGLDLEMAITEHYYEVLEVFSELFIFIFDGLNERYSGGAGGGERAAPVRAAAVLAALAAPDLRRGHQAAAGRRRGRRRPAGRPEHREREEARGHCQGNVWDRLLHHGQVSLGCAPVLHHAMPRQR